MPKTTYPGIDYGNGTSNFNPKTGIRFGIISQNELSGDAVGEFEPEYPKPSEAECPECGHCVPAINLSWGDSVTCPECNSDFEIEGGDMDEPSSHSYSSGGYECSLDSHGDVWVFKSPFYTYAQFCSPCAPGAGHLGNPFEPATPLTESPAYNEEYANLAEGAGFPKVYCFGHDWFDEGKAPYPLFSVEPTEGQKRLNDAVKELERIKARKSNDH